MLKVQITLSIVLCAALSVAAPSTLPPTISDDVKSVVQKAEKAVDDNDYHLALALYNGALYSDGIKLAVDMSSVDNFDQLDAVKFALQTWSKELGGDFPVTLVDSESEADIVLSFVNDLGERGADALGEIHLSKNYRWNSERHEISYEGTIQVVRSAQGDNLTQAETLDVVMHEIGHLLGLGDTSKVGVLMGPLRRGHPLNRPTVNETEDVRTLRALLRERIQQVQTLARKSRSNQGELNLEYSHAVRFAK